MGSRKPIAEESGVIAERSIHFLHVWTIGSWKLKAYSIRLKNRQGPVADEVLHAGFRVARQVLQEIDVTKVNQYGVGFVGIHEGTRGLFIFVDWWADRHELHHVGYYSEGKDGIDLKPCEPSDAIACIWDIRLMEFEARAWARSLMSAEPSKEQYLLEVLGGDDSIHEAGV